MTFEVLVPNDHTAPWPGGTGTIELTHLSRKNEQSGFVRCETTMETRVARGKRRGEAGYKSAGGEDEDEGKE